MFSLGCNLVFHTVQEEKKGDCYRGLGHDQNHQGEEPEDELPGNRPAHRYQTPHCQDRSGAWRAACLREKVCTALVAGSLPGHQVTYLWVTRLLVLHG